MVFILLIYTGFFVLLRRGRDGWVGACPSSLPSSCSSLSLRRCRSWCTAVGARSPPGAVGAAAGLAIGYGLQPRTAHPRRPRRRLLKLGAMLRFWGDDTFGNETASGLQRSCWTLASCG